MRRLRWDSGGYAVGGTGMGEPGPDTWQAVDTVVERLPAASGRII